MVIADSIPGLENFLNSTPEQIGLAVYAKRARKERFHPANSIDAVATGSASRGLSYEFQRVRFEGVA